MKAQLRLRDGTVFTFSRTPEDEVAIEGGRQLAKVFIPGVGEIVQDMGPSAPIIPLRGVLAGEEAQQEFDRLEEIAGSGEVVTFQFGEVVRKVLVEKARFAVVRRGEVFARYDLTLVQADALSLTKERTNDLLR